MTKAWEIVKDLVVFALIVGVVLTGLWALFAGIPAADQDQWEKIDDAGDCYLHIAKVNNMWLTPGSSTPEQRVIYCKGT